LAHKKSPNFRALVYQLVIRKVFVKVTAAHGADRNQAISI
jgi:hypothetical protein